MRRRFKVILDWDDEGKGYVAQVPPLPGCATQGRTRAEVMDRAKEAVHGYLEASAPVTRASDWYVARCAEAEVTSQGDTVEEALANLCEALELYFEDAPPHSPADPRPGNQPYYIAPNCSKCGTLLVLSARLDNPDVPDDEVWYDEWESQTAGTPFTSTGPRTSGRLSWHKDRSIPRLRPWSTFGTRDRSGSDPNGTEPYPGGYPPVASG